MNREIKFRAFDDGAMIYSHTNIINDPYFQLGYFFNKIRPDAIVMRFTGLLDKNGKEVYESDIIRVCNNNNGYFKVIFANAYMGGWILESLTVKDGYISLGARKQDEIEIIGNIYEHKNLLP